jgi:acetolactate synthase-1/2/3 large subunit
LAAPTRARIERVLPTPLLGPAPVDLINKAANLIRQAQRPALLVGARGADPQSCAALRALVATTGLPVVETFQAAGMVSHALEDHYLGRVGLFRNQPGDVVVANADVLVTVGYDAVEYDPVLWNADVDRTVVHIDTIPADVDNNYQPILELRGSVSATLDELTPLLSDLVLADGYSSALAEQRQVLTDIDEHARSASAQGHGVNPAALVLALRDGLDDDATVACDIGSVYIYMARHFRVYQPRHLLFSNGQQTLGVALPWAMAASMVRPGTQVVSISGDGGFLFSAQELETATRLGLTFTHVIMRDNTYDMVGFQEVLKYGRKSGVQLGDYDSVSYAQSFGARGYRVATLDEFQTVLKQTLSDDGPSLIDVPVDYSHNTELGAQLHEGAFE